MRFKIPSIFLFLFFVGQPLWAVVAPQNDICSKAHTIREVKNWCSSPRQFTTEGATASGIPKGVCWSDFLLDPNNDVWFKFNAVATSVNISIVGALDGKPGGTLRNPQMAIYRGSCGAGLQEIACISDAQGYNIVETFVNYLTIGETYYIRVDGRRGQMGSFQICVNNFNPVPSPASDCSSAVVLCDKSSFTVPNVTGAGKDRNEIPYGTCFDEESSSAWYKWTCDQPGSLTFTIRPVNPGDDIDFALFMLPFGVEDCAMKVPYRCMASGETVDAPFSLWQSCTGPTGLRSGDRDLREDKGCEPGNNNFLAPLKMEAGKSYALLINNFHNTGNGFSIEFGGTGTFKGPKAHFVVNKLKLSQDQILWVKNASSFEGGIKSYEYNFGKDAKPQKSKKSGPHQIQYRSPGKKSISLTIETNNGCKVTKVRNVTITSPPPPPPEPEEPEAQEEVIAEQEKPETTEPSSGPSAAPPPPPKEILEEKAMVTEEAKSPEPPSPPKAESLPEEITFIQKFTATVYFPSDSSSLDSEDKELLAEVVRLMKEGKDRTAVIEGHTNNIPSDDYCKKLAQARAESVIDYLVSRGIPREKLVRKVYGKDKIYGKEKKFESRRIYQRAVVKIMERKE